MWADGRGKKNASLEHREGSLSQSSKENVSRLPIGSGRSQIAERRPVAKFTTGQISAAILDG